MEEVARFLGGRTHVEIVAPAAAKTFDLSVVVPVADMSELGTTPMGDESDDDSRTASIWPHVEEAIVERVLAHRSSIVFANSRRLAERLTARLNELYDDRIRGGDAELPAATRSPAELIGGSGQTRGQSEQTVGMPLARAHHGSVSKEQRAVIEDDLKSGRLRCVVATSSLELGIDMGAVDLVVQVEAPPSVASGLQRIGRAGHQVGEISRGVVFPKHRADLVHATVATERMTAGLIESLSVPSNPLDILAQQTVAATALEPIDADEWFDTLRRSAPFASLPRSAYDATLDLLAGRYPSDEFAELRPRIVWDRDSGTLTGRPGAQRLAVTSGGTIPDRGLFGVFLVGDKPSRVGELDEEMVYESRVGDVFALGSTSWRIQEITHDRVMVTPAFGEPGRLPFWKGDGVGRPLELGRAIGAFTREVGSASEDDARSRCRAAGLDEWATDNLLAFFSEQRAATGQLPTDRTLVVERFRDELGDWRLVMHSPFGMQVHAPWALAVGARVRDSFGVEGSSIASDDGIVVRIPDTEAEPPGAALFVFDPDELERLVTDQVGGSALFAARFRECAARALLLPHYRPGTRSPLWQQRQRAAQLLDVARKYPAFPIILETVRECLQDVYDLPALGELARGIAERRIRLVETTTEQASPFAKSLLFGYVAAFMYEGDSPLAERRAAALSLDPGLLADLLGRAELRELLDPAVIERVEKDLQRISADRRMRGVEGVADLLRLLGPLTTDEVAARLSDDGPDPHASAHALLSELVENKRALPVAFGGRSWWAAIEDAARLRDALGVPLPIGVPVAFVEPVDDPLGDLVSRFARTHGPFTTEEAAVRFGLGTAVVHDALRRLAHDRRIVEGEFRPHATGNEWCEAEVLRRLRRLSLAALRHEVEPVEPRAFARFLPDWQHVGGTLRGVDAVASVIEQLAGTPVPASAWESLILPSRVRDYSPAMLDQLTAAGEVVWAGAGALPGNDGWVSLHLAETAPLTLPIGEPASATDIDPVQRDVLDVLARGGGFFFRQLADAVGAARVARRTGDGPVPRDPDPAWAAPVDDAALADAIWELTWSGLVTNDTLAPLRVLTSGAGAHKTPRAVPRARLYGGRLPRPASATRNGPPTTAGRWSLLPAAETDATLRAHALAETLLERYGVVTRGSVTNEGAPGGFALAYKVLSGFEDSGRCRRGYFIETLGAAQFATGATVDRLRSFVLDAAEEPPRRAVALAATDPANPYGAALPWPAGSGHRPGRKAGALVVLVDGELTLYIERGGKTVLSFSDDRASLEPAARALSALITHGNVLKLAIEAVNGGFVLGTTLGDALIDAGFLPTPRGLRLRS
jgi:ATP-dependent Lhr-like helicase